MSNVVVIGVVGVRILGMWCVGLTGAHYLANNTSYETVCCLVPECGDRRGKWCCVFISSESFFNG